MASEPPKFYENPPRMVVGSDEGDTEVTVNVCARDGAWMVKWYLGQQSKNVKKACLKKWSLPFSPPSNQESVQRQKVIDAFIKHFNVDLPIKKEKKEVTGKAKQTLKDTKKPSSSITPSLHSRQPSWTAINRHKPRQPSVAASLVPIGKPSAKRTRQPSVATSSTSIGESRSKRTKTDDGADDGADDGDSQSDRDYIEGLFGERWAALDSKAIKLISHEMRDRMSLTKPVPSHVIINMKKFNNTFGPRLSVFQSMAWDTYLDETKQWIDEEDLPDTGATPLGSKGEWIDPLTAPTTRSVVFTLIPDSAFEPMENWLPTLNNRVFGAKGHQGCSRVSKLAEGMLMQFKRQ